MKPNHNFKLSLAAAIACIGVAAILYFSKSPTTVLAQGNPSAPAPAPATNAASSADAAANPPSVVAAPVAATNTPAAAAISTNAAVVAPASANSPPAIEALTTNQTASAASPASAPPPASGAAPPEAEKLNSSEPIELSFQGANVDMIVQWLAKATGKSVVKHPRVQCQLTIVSSKKLPAREAITLVYRALAMEGFTALESSKSILLVPEGQEPKMSPEFMEGSAQEIPEGRQRLIKVFPVQHLAPNDLKERIKALLSEKGTIDADEGGRRLIVTDYTENLRLLAQLIPELDVAAVPDAVIEIFTLKFSDANELGNLLGLILNERAASGSSAAKGASTPPQPQPGPPMPSSSSPSSSGGAVPAAGGQIRLWPDKTSNRLIVSAPRGRIPEIKELIETLDTEKPEDVAVRVIALKHVSAQDLVKEIAPLYQKMAGKSIKDGIEIAANNRSNSLIVLSNEANFKTIEGLVSRLDTEEAQEKVLQTFALKNGDAEDVAKQLQELYRDQSSSSRYYYYFSAPDEKSKKISFVANRRSNSVVVQAPPSAMAGIGDMIRALDEPVTDDTLVPQIYRMKYVSAVDIEDVLNELFMKKQQQRSYWDYYYDSSERDTQEAGRLFGKVRITSEPYSNSLIVSSNSPESLKAVEDILKQLDAPSQAGETTLRVGLNFAEAVAIANSINILFARGGSPPLRPVAQPGNPQDQRNQQQANNSYQSGFQLEQEVKEDTYFPWLGGQQENFRSSDGQNTVRPVSELVGRVRVVPDRRSNSLLITSNMHFFPQVLKLINDLDAPTAQVLIEAKIIEVASDFRDKLGVRWSPDGARTFDADDLDGSISPSAAASFTEVFAGSTAATALRTGILDSKVNLDVLIQFLRKNTDSTVLAEPQINVSDNELGKLFVGSQVPFISSSLNTQEGGRNDAFQYRDVGIILEVTPHINNSEEVGLKIRAESSNIRNGQTLFGGAILDTRNFRTDLLVKTGQTVVLGGIIQREDVDTVRKVPILGSIPGLGWAFKKKDKVTREVELMVFLRPRITRTPEEVQQLLEEVERRTPRLKQWKDQAEGKQSSESKPR